MTIQAKNVDHGVPKGPTLTTPTRWRRIRSASKRRQSIRPLTRGSGWDTIAVRVLNPVEGIHA